jgi:hypothetical protein
MAEEYERTIGGLLKKRAEMVGELHALRERMGVVTNDLQSLDRVLQAFGYDGNLDELPVVRSKMVMFHKSELQQHLLHVLRNAGEPLSSRDLAVRIVSSEGRDRYDKRLILDLIKRVGKAIRTLRDRGLVTGCRDSRGRYLWRLRTGGSLPESKVNPQSH